MNEQLFTESVQKILKSKTEFMGHMCSAPNMLLLHTDDLERFQRFAQVTETAPSDSSILRKPIFVKAEDTKNLQPAEWFSPVCSLLCYSNEESLMEILTTTALRLQFSLFDDQPDQIHRIIEKTYMPRYCINMIPSHQDSALPWGNSGLSGESDVHDFYRKGLSRIIVESWP